METPAVYRPVLFDLGPLSEDQTDHALEAIYKAQSDLPPEQADIWEPHHSPFVRELIERFTDRGLTRIEAVRRSLVDWESGSRHVPSKTIPDRPGLHGRWSPDEIALARLYLESLPPAEWLLDDWLLAAELAFQQYLPPDFAWTEADWLAKRAVLMGRVQASMAEISEVGATALLEAEAVPAATEKALQAAVTYGRARAAENIVALSDGLRHRIRRVLIEHAEVKALRVAPESTLESRLLDDFGLANRDWRRIAITETTEVQGQGVIASLPIGSKVRRHEQYRGACKFCLKIHGMVFTVVPPDQPYKDPWRHFWVGKSNVGRSFSPRKRVGGLLIERDPEELAVPVPGAQHPHCFISPTVGVYTSTGYKRIASIAVGDLVLTHQGRFRPVNWVLKGARHTGEVVRPVFGGTKAKSIPFTTPEHPYLTDRGWVEAGKLLVGDKIVVLAKICAGCGKPFVNMKHSKVNYCSQQCIERPGINQFSNPENREEARQIISEANKRRMRGMTIEQRRELTRSARAVMAERGYDHLSRPGIRQKGNRAVTRTNYAPSELEQRISEMLMEFGVSVQTQYRIEQGRTNSAGRPRYWWADIAIPESKIAVEIDGAPWHKPEFRDDADRDRNLQENGWMVLRFDSKVAASNPAAVAEEVARIAMNHAHEYEFASVEVVAIDRKSVSNKILYNFGVEEDESYVIGGGVVVHNCRGVNIPVEEAKSSGDPQFDLWVQEMLAKVEI